MDNPSSPDKPDWEASFEERIAQAKEKKILQKAYNIADSLGTYSFWRGRTRYEKDSLAISFEMKFVFHRYFGLGYLKVMYEGKLVFAYDWGPEITHYIPGKWEEEIERLYSELEAKEKGGEEAKLKVREAGLKERFGL